MKAAISKIETFSIIDGPGIRTVIFFQGCNLRCKFCHNPETWKITKNNYTVDELKKIILKNKPYFQNNGGVTFSGGEPLLHKDFLINLCKELKKENIHIALDTAGIVNNNNLELLKLVDLIILDIKAINEENFINITQKPLFIEFLKFIKTINKLKKEVWIRQVIIPDINDNKEYMDNLYKFINNNIKNVTKIELLPFHTMAFTKYKELNIDNKYKNKEAMDKEKCNELENYIIKKAINELPK